MKKIALPLSIVAASLLSACGLYGPMVDNSALPEAIRVPAGQTVFMLTNAAGELTYECREKKDTAGAFEWAFVGPVASLKVKGETVGKYYAGPTWESNDGSKVTGKQVAVSPNGAGNIPLQLVKANPTDGKGAMGPVTFIQRLNTQGGVAPAAACGADQKGQRQQVNYTADYALYKASM